MSLEIDPEAALVFGLACQAGESLPAAHLTFSARWERLVQLASAENALIALRDQLGAQAQADRLPKELQRQLAVLALDGAYHMRLFQARFEESIAALSSAGIEVILLKGAALAYTTYGSFVARPMRDIDLLVRPADAIAARDVLLGIGWELDPHFPDDVAYGAHQHLPPLRDSAVRGLRLEIHHSLLARGHPFRFRDDEIWDTAASVTIQTARARVMHPAHHSVYLAIHFAWSHQLKWGAWHAFRDLDALTAAGQLDWETIATTARQWGALSACYWTLKLGSHLSGLAVPEAILIQLEPRLPEFMLGVLTRHFLNGLLGNGRACPSIRLERMLWSLAMLPRRDKHGQTRPWILVQELTAVFTEKARCREHSDPRSALSRMRQASEYVTGLLS